MGILPYTSMRFSHTHSWDAHAPIHNHVHENAPIHIYENAPIQIHGNTPMQYENAPLQ